MKPWSGLGTIDHADPFQDSVRVSSASNPPSTNRTWPTAAHHVGPVQDTPSSWLLSPPWLGLGVTDQSEGTAAAAPADSSTALSVDATVRQTNTERSVRGERRPVRSVAAESSGDADALHECPSGFMATPNSGVPPPVLLFLANYPLGPKLPAARTGARLRAAGTDPSPIIWCRARPLSSATSAIGRGRWYQQEPAGPCRGPMSLRQSTRPIGDLAGQRSSDADHHQ